jgi:uncharacterized alkaline shock family protein YloU
MSAMDECEHEIVEELLGKVTIAPDVLVTIARLATLSVPGVCRMAPHWAAWIKGATGAASEGTRLLVEDGVVFADLYIVVDGSVSMLDVGSAVQASVSRAIRDMVGMEVGEVNVHIEDVEFPCPSTEMPLS